MTRLRTLALAAAILAAGTLTATAQQPVHTPPEAPSITPPRNEAPEIHSWTIEQLMPLTVSEAWHLSGKNEDKFFDMVQDLAAYSAQHRGLILPESEEAGKKSGEYIKARAKADPGELLYAIVDHAVRKIGTKAPVTASK
jgi:hypothetical protein